ncbi:hypothetical protein CN556_21830 [Bacillus wiedmannii]|uniref:hypothetical protein n=1 Tax=Bacillus TaxID=1386 RepID=UPI00085741CA|nr:hypothetical protein [Bacillus wiedmannii]AZJ19095.1 hypothetical protein CT694_05020 [Bacillus wiedmannii bv. thuringiensis]OWT51997.1 hypothetical protein CER22_07520 [Bacillus sp. K2I17]MCU5499758.1 hypothetical protein [Bacillus wiedmannii]MED2882504.1 hypothetical protein [Bacillus wiedmannii]PEC57876.1 hypothetical protein CON91_30810 [Bacillus wiedmannii]
MAAGVLNIGHNLVRSIGSSVIDVRGNINIRDAKQALFMDRNMFNVLATGVFECCFNVFYAFLCEYEKFTGYQSPKFEVASAASILENTKKYILEKVSPSLHSS